MRRSKLFCLERICENNRLKRRIEPQDGVTEPSLLCEAAQIVAAADVVFEERRSRPNYIFSDRPTTIRGEKTHALRFRHL